MTLRRLLAAAACAAAAVVVPAAPAQAACSGVTVVVDFGSLGGGVQTRCAGGDPGTGLAALDSAGFGYTFVPRQPGLICQLNSRPDPCNGAPKDAYWAYFHARAGGSWTYSDEGAGSYDPAPGSVEGWAFGAGRQPGIAPPAAPAPPPPPAPAPPAPQTPGPGHPEPEKTTAPGPQSAAPSAATGTTPVPDSSSLRVTEAPTEPGRSPVGADQRPEGATSLPWQGGLLLVAVIAGLALWQVKRRRAA
ncbi:hypothetical protein Lfu02_29240 [Longispora fulva]|uniref:Uncharacterized protein n=1 Tax=Longispora fulva TaxID=619741 RepID=A0A8J7GH96_9ACTN|nr:hypothetical protein [Longispora fulva]MBG6139059.1 hypothetical protein [Longispora fulva]GIG58552.1 hypothetical protein Lfu02_29240 [Longispora fulva]